jgi:hypothetical protein
VRRTVSSQSVAVDYVIPRVYATRDDDIEIGSYSIHTTYSVVTTNHCRTTAFDWSTYTLIIVVCIYLIPLEYSNVVMISWALGFLVVEEYIMVLSQK